MASAPPAPLPEGPEASNGDGISALQVACRCSPIPFGLSLGALRWPPTGAAAALVCWLAGQQWFSPSLDQCHALTAGSWSGVEEASAGPHPLVVVPRADTVRRLAAACRPSCRPTRCRGGNRRR